MNLAWAFDILLLVCLVGSAVWMLVAGNLFQSVVVFIAFGLFSALAWVRLSAPDVALAEAAIGAGLTGVLLLGCLRYSTAATARGDKK
ncbi:MAG: Na(+)/H(+) antiporter subunit B [Limisphaerales bacterium]